MFYNSNIYNLDNIAKIMINEKVALSFKYIFNYTF